ncbi:MAG TPA: MgtC/SapB family protein, partial [Usitatibacteraceae bacterium]|nr:MgtC/SapB family protein [Usitatibacteraceae bacterium]
DSRSAPDAGTTTVMAAALTFCLGAAVWYGYSGIVIAVAIVVTGLLHYKTQLEGFSVRLNATDMASLLQFAVLSLVILPVVPNTGFGPYGALNPYNLWLMVVLISAVSLAGYVAWRLLGGKGPVLLLGALGGLVSSTATTLVYSRGARGKPDLEGTAATVILLANLVVLLRLSVLAVAVAPSILPTMLPVVAAGLLAGLPIAWSMWRKNAGGEAMENPELTNPTDLPVALGFGVAYAVVLVAAAWLNDLAGARGVYAVALVSGLTDVDAISLSSFRLFGNASLTASGAVMAIVVALCSNIVVKATIVFVAGGASLGKRCITGFAGVAAALVAVAALMPS